MLATKQLSADMRTVVYPVNALKAGGAEQQLLELVRGLDKRQFRPIVAPLYPAGPLDAEFRAVPGVEVIDLHRRGKYDPSPVLKIARLLRARRADVVQPFLTPATFFGLLPALVVGTPVKIVTERTGVQRFRGLGHKSYLAIEDVLTRGADAVVANSLAGQRLLVARGIPATKTRVFYNGVNPERVKVQAARAAAVRAQVGVPANGQLVSILATLTPAKDHASFLFAAAKVSASRPGVRYAIVGDGPLRGELEALSVALGLTERVAFLGYQRHVGDILAASDLLVSSSRDNEGCSNSILEAMFLGVPVVATDVGGNAELIANGVTGYLTRMQDPHALAASIERRLADPTATAATVERARQQAHERFSLRRMVADYEGLYHTLLAAKGRPATVTLAAPCA
jgi:glycosyltransferase involved in cell wall biosynthesis